MADEVLSPLGGCPLLPFGLPFPDWAAAAAFLRFSSILAAFSGLLLRQMVYGLKGTLCKMGRWGLPQLSTGHFLPQEHCEE